VHEAVLKPGWETILVAVPFIFLLLFSYFKLDAVFTARKKPAMAPRSTITGLDKAGNPILCDPDGRPSHKPRSRK